MRSGSKESGRRLLGRRRTGLACSTRSSCPVRRRRARDGREMRKSAQGKIGEGASGAVLARRFRRGLTLLDVTRNLELSSALPHSPSFSPFDFHSLYRAPIDSLPIADLRHSLEQTSMDFSAALFASTSKTPRKPAPGRRSASGSGEDASPESGTSEGKKRDRLLRVVRACDVRQFPDDQGNKLGERLIHHRGFVHRPAGRESRGAAAASHAQCALPRPRAPSSVATNLRNVGRPRRGSRP